MERSAVFWGDNCIDMYDDPGKRRFAGGNAVNTAVHAKEAGCKTSYVGAVGSDANGRAICRKLDEKGIDVSHVQIFDAETAWTKVTLSEGERRFIAEYPGPRDSFVVSDETDEFLLSHALIHNTWQGGTEQELYRLHQKNRALISMDFGERYSEDFLKSCIANVDIAFFSMDPDEAQNALAFAKSMNVYGPEYVVVTMGKNGSVVSQRSGMTYVCPAKVIDAVDTLGAGDTYIGTFIASFVTQKPIEECMKLATEAAARNCLIFGGFEGSEIVVEE